MSNSDFEIPTKPTPPRINPSDLPVSNEAQAQAETQENTSTAPKYTQEELMQIFDEILFSGEYQETVRLRGKLNVKFRTRTAEEIGEIQAELDRLGLNLISSVEQRRSVLMLEKALANYHGKDLTLLKPDERKKFVGKIPGPIVGSLLNALQMFDQKVFEACKEGESNF